MRRFRFKQCKSCLHHTVPQVTVKQLKAARIKAGLSQAKAANLIGYSVLTYNRIECGAMKASDAFLVLAGRLLFGPKSLQKEYKTR